MKLRNSFVTNSSSISFCIVGTGIYDIDDMLEEKLKTLVELHKKHTGQELDIQEMLDNYGVSDVLCKLFPDLAIYYEDGCAYVGFPIEDMRDDETLGEFKADALKKMKALEILGESIKEVNIITATIGY